MNAFLEQSVRLFSFSDANVRFVFLGMILLGLSGGVLGSFTLLRKRALIGDALAHAALPGIAIAYLLTNSKSIGILLIGAYIAGVLGILVILLITKFSRIKEDSALAIVLTVFFGVGIVLLTFIQKSGRAGQSGLDKFLFGQSASLIANEVIVIGVVTFILLLASFLFYKEFKLLCFDSNYASALGFPAVLLDILLMGLTVGAVVIGLQAVGVVLMAAILIIPASTARMWSHRLGMMIVIAGVIGAASGAIGSYLSFMAPRMPSGPLVVVASGTLFGISLLLSPETGLIRRFFRRRNQNKNTVVTNCLRAIAELAEVIGCDLNRQFSTIDIATIRKWTTTETKRYLKLLKDKKLLEFSDSNTIQLTESGCEDAKASLKRHRLWELYLMYQADIAPDHVDRDAEEAEHFFTPELERQLLKLAGSDVIESPHEIEFEGGTNV